MLKILAAIFVLIILIGTGAYLGFIYSKRISILQNRPIFNDENEVEKLFSSHSAQIAGRIIKIEGDTLLIKTLSNLTGKVKASSSLRIQKYDKSGRLASPSSSLSSIETDQDVILVLNKIKGQFLVVSINYFPPAPENLPGVNIR